jgi:hypothetical protein
MNKQLWLNVKEEIVPIHLDKLNQMMNLSLNLKGLISEIYL